MSHVPVKVEREVVIGQKRIITRIETKCAETIAADYAIRLLRRLEDEEMLGEWRASE